MDKTRVRGVSIHRPVIYGNSAVLLTPEEKEIAPQEHTYRWTVALRSPAQGADSDIVGGADDMSYFIKRVVFKLHDTYPSPSRTCDKPPYEVAETGWGEFDIQIRITFVPESGEKPLAFYHRLKLHPYPAIPTVPATQNGEPVPPPERAEPVHSWQYDEVVFTEPSQSFLNILTQYPPTPLPKLNKRQTTLQPQTFFLTGKGTPEFTSSTEKEESGRLEEARKDLIGQGEEWRSKLIEKENELHALKAMLKEK